MRWLFLQSNHLCFLVFDSAALVTFKSVPNAKWQINGYPVNPRHPTSTVTVTVTVTVISPPHHSDIANLATASTTTVVQSVSSSREEFSPNERNIDLLISQAFLPNIRDSGVYPCKFYTGRLTLDSLNLRRLRLFKPSPFLWVMGMISSNRPIFTNVMNNL
jgi:hypothetical protein